MKKISSLVLSLLLFVTTVIANPKKEKCTYIKFETTKGELILKLYNETPKHRDNMIDLVKTGFYDSILFHRVIKNFMIQGGDPDSKQATAQQSLGNGEAKNRALIPAEFNPNLIHRKGVLAAARDNNPEKSSSNCQFYIVQGKKIDTAQLRQTAEQRIKANPNSYNYTAAQKEIYQRIGGTPFLDQNYTVFGEVISGLNVLDAIANSPTQPGDRPKKDIIMKIRLLN